MPFDINARIDVWRTQLLDTSRKNRLINFKVGRSGGIALVHPDPGDIWDRLVAGNAGLAFAWKRDLIDLPPEGEEVTEDDPTQQFLFARAKQQEDDPAVLDQCRDSPLLRPEHLLTELPDGILAGRLTRLALNARESLAEQGVATLHVAFGILRWFESADSQIEIRSPLLLVSARLERDGIEAPWRLQAEDEEVLPNHSLMHLLANDFGLRLPDFETEVGDADDSNWRTRYFGAVQRCVRHQSRWEVHDEVALGTFRFQKLAMWEDLGRNRHRLAEHEMCRAIAGDPDAHLRCPADLPGARDLDRVAHPSTVFHILDADSSQHEAIAAATRGASLVLDGPPGTGKSQTIANIIAEFLAAGKTVLFVSEKAAALEVVQRRLQDRGLGDFCLNCHSHKANKREVVRELTRCLALPPEPCRPHTEELQRLHAIRQYLNDYVRELHALRPPLNMTAYQVSGELARLARMSSRSRCAIPDVLSRDANYLRRVTELLARLPACRDVIADSTRHPWRGCRAPACSPILGEDVRHHFGRLAATLERLAEVVTTLHGLSFCVEQPTVAQWRQATSAARTVGSYPQLPAHWFRSDTRSIVEAAIQLDDRSKAYRHTRASMPEFAPEALRRADAGNLASLAMPSSGPALVPRSGDTLHSMRKRAALVGGLLGKLHGLASEVAQTVQKVGELLRTPVISTPVKGLARLAEWVALIARLPAIRPSWWDARRRKELLTFFSRCQDETQTAQEGRTALAVRLSPRAFLPESAGLAARASRFRWFVTRLFPAWWSIKAQVLGWYAGEVPSTAVLLDDLGKLAAYHRRIDYRQQVRVQYAADLQLGEDGEPDWAKTVEALRSIDRLEQLATVRAPLRAVLSENGVDRQGLATAARALETQYAALREQLAAVAREADLGEMTAAPPDQIRLPVRELMEWLESRRGALTHLATVLDQLAGLLAEGRDVPAELLPVRVNQLAELGRLRGEVASLCARISPGQPLLPDAEEKDWSALRHNAAVTLHLLDAYRGQIPPPIIQVLTSASVRAQLAEAVRRNDAVIAEGFEESWQFLAELFDLTRPVSTGITIDGTPFADLCRWLGERAEDAHRLQEWIRFSEVQRQAEKEGISPLLAEVLDGQLKPEEAAEAFQARFFGLWLEAVHQRVGALQRFATDDHERLIDQFRDLDRRAVASATARIRAFQLARADRPRAVVGEAVPSSELWVLLRESNKKRRHLPLRKLFAAIPTVLLRLKPCVMMSPLAVSTYLDTPEIHFDLVIFDEASQVRPHDAICAIYRGRQLLVAGDQKQLPPTSFFDRVLETEGPSGEEESSLEDYESVLDVCCTLGMLRRRLRWHYRSKREGLIAFSNQFVYGNELVTFPSVEDVAGNPAVAFEHVADGRWKAGAGGSFNAVEARRTAVLVLEHFRQRPDESLGVIAFSQRQQMRILEELERLRKANPDLEEFFQEERDNPFFVKNLENVQGDERDAIILAVGYGPDETSGRVAMRFGPLNQQGGERRLNVAVTRARQRVLVVSSMRAGDIDLTRTAALGVKLLRTYLDYAERGPEALRGAITSAGDRVFDSPFEQEVWQELTQRGLTVHPQVGCGGFRIDLGIVDPRAPGRYLLGVECDGATYHSCATARDRDRLRQQVLEELLRWRICRVWSTDWLRDPEGQVRRVQAALEQARHRSPPPAPRTLSPLHQDQPADGESGQVDAVAPATDLPLPSNYPSIDDVPEDVLREELCRLLRTFGGMEDGELIKAVARQLGFKRTGGRIQSRVEESLACLIQAGQVRRMADQRIQVTSLAASQSGG
jgi:very-short-patch-repair endonuclease